MKELLVQYAQYNVWANGLIADTLLKLNDEQADRELVSSFSGIRKTLHHVMAAEDTWLQRLQHVAQPVWVGNDFPGSLADACAFWANASGNMLQYLAGVDDTVLKIVLSYKDRSNNEHSTPVYEILHHVFNHSTYHRGQMVTMLRQCGVMEIPGTDFIAYVRM